MSSKKSQIPSYIGIDGLLQRLDRVRCTKPGHWVARSPTRDDKTPSLHIRVLDDGRILLHDFGDSDYFEILSVLGIHPIELVPDSLRSSGSSAEPHRAPIPCCDAIRAVAFQASVIQIAGEMLARGEVLSETSLNQLAHAVDVIDNAMAVVRRGDV